MIQLFVDRFMESKQGLRDAFTEEEPDSYEDIVREVCRTIYRDDYTVPQPSGARITVIGHDDYEGTLLFVIADDSFSPDTYWYTKVAYGSCGYCDTLQGIHDNHGPENATQRIDDYMALALHILQNLKEMP